MTRTILVCRSGRADGSPLNPVSDEIAKAGMTVAEAVVSGPGIIGDMETYIRRHNPDIVLLLGDRWETLAAALGATVCGVPIAHIHGGEHTAGSFDNQLRHAISKLAHVHFVSCEDAELTLYFDLGEQLKSIHVVGAPGLDNVSRIMKERIRTTATEILLTWHPPTLSDDPVRGLRAIMDALRFGPDGALGHDLVWTGCNNDPGSAAVRAFIFERAEPDGIIFAEGMTADEYLRRARDAALLIGNSSGGVIEGPTLMTPVVDVGDRQEGRPHGPSVFHADEDADDIATAIDKALLYDGPWDNPFGEPGASFKIADVLRDLDLTSIRRKELSPFPCHTA